MTITKCFVCSQIFLFKYDISFDYLKPSSWNMQLKGDKEGQIVFMVYTAYVWKLYLENMIRKMSEWPNRSDFGKSCIILQCFGKVSK